MKLCVEHNKEFKIRDGKNGPFYSHVVSGNKEEGFKYHNSDLDKISEVAKEADNIPYQQAQQVFNQPDLKREPIKETDWDGIARGKTKCAVITAIITHGGLEALKGKADVIENVVDYIMNPQIKLSEG